MEPRTRRLAVLSPKGSAEERAQSIADFVAFLKGSGPPEPGPPEKPPVDKPDRKRRPGP